MAEQARITKGAMVELVDYPQARGYVARLPDPSDGRAKIIRLTPRGWEAVQVVVVVVVVAAAITDVENRWRDGLGPRRMSMTRRALAEMPELLSHDVTQPAPKS